MKSEKIRLYTIELALIIFLLLAMIFSNTITRQITAIILLVFMAINIKLIKNNKQEFTNKRQIIILLTAIGAIYVALIYILGIFVGFYNATVKLSIWSILNYIIPYIVIIISSEIIRKNILLKENKKSRIIILIAMVMLDIILWTNIYNLKTVQDYFTLIFFIIFSSIANNLLYNYIVIKYRNTMAIIVYRLITTLYMYIFPIVPNIYIFFEAIIRLIVPYIIYLIIDALYSKKNVVVLAGQKRKETIISAILCAIVAIIIMLVSCKFKFGVLTIGSGSMTGTINKGDIVLYERYDEDQTIKTGDIIVFIDGDIRVVHRVVEQRDLGDEIRYYTKGDANIQEDDGYRVRNDVVGQVKFRIPYIGYLTLWINDMFE